MSQIHKRQLVKTLLGKNEISPKLIAKYAGVSLATVYNVKARVKSNTTLAHKKGGGRPKILRLSSRLSIAQNIRRKPHLSLRTIAKKLSKPISYQTVRRALMDLNYSKRLPVKVPMLSEKNRLARIKWAKKFRYPKKEWAKTVFVDEMSIWLSRGQVKVWTKKYKKIIAPTTKHVPKINVWAGFSSMATFPLCIFRENMDSNMFLDIMHGHLITQAKIFHDSDWRLVLDNDPKHTAIKVQEWLSKTSRNNYHGHLRVPMSTQSKISSVG